MSISEIIDMYLSEERKWNKIGNDQYMLDTNSSITIKKKGSQWIIYSNGSPKSKAKSLKDAKNDAELFIHD